MFEGGGKTGPKSGQFSKAADNQKIEQKRDKEIKAIFPGFSGEGWECASKQPLMLLLETPLENTSG